MLTQTLAQTLTLILTQTLTQTEEKHYFASRGKMTTSKKKNVKNDSTRRCADAVR